MDNDQSKALAASGGGTNHSAVVNMLWLNDCKLAKERTYDHRTSQ